MYSNITFIILKFSGFKHHFLLVSTYVAFWFIKQSEVLDMWALALAQLPLYFICIVTYGNDELISLKHGICDYLKRWPYLNLIRELWGVSRLWNVISIIIIIFFIILISWTKRIPAGHLKCKLIMNGRLGSQIHRSLFPPFPRNLLFCNSCIWNEGMDQCSR